jgi:hypothetical protein
MMLSWLVVMNRSSLCASTMTGQAAVPAFRTSASLAVMADQLSCLFAPAVICG